MLLYHDVKRFMKIHNNPVAIVVDCSKMSRSDEPRGEPSLLGLSRGEDASRREPRSEDAQKNFAPQRGSVYLSIAVQSYGVSSSLSKKGAKVPTNLHLFFFRGHFRSFS